MLEHIMLKDYKSLNKGDRVTILKADYDSGYEVYLIESKIGRIEKPLRKDVASVKNMEDQLKFCEEEAVRLRALLGIE